MKQRPESFCHTSSDFAMIVPRANAVEKSIAPPAHPGSYQAHLLDLATGVREQGGKFLDPPGARAGHGPPLLLVRRRRLSGLM